MEKFDYLKSVLTKNNCDCLYVNHTNKYFSEYVDVSRSSRFLLTGFSGSTGDAIVTNNKIYLFVDSRYWEQAESEVDKKNVEVVKLGTDLTFEKALLNILNKGATVLFYDEKTSFSLYEKFLNWGYKVVLTNKDYVAENIKPLNIEPDFKKIKNSIVGRSEKQKIKKLQNKLRDNEVLIVSSLEDVSYLLNLKSNAFEYSSTIFGKIIIDKNKYEFYLSDIDFEKALKSYKGAKFLIDKASLSVKYKKYFKIYEQAKLLSTLISLRYNSEIKHLQSCFERTDKVVRAAYENLQKFNYKENEFFDFVNEKFIEYGAETTSFKTIAASGKNSSVVHFSHPTNRVIKDGDFVLLDCGGFYEGGYATDITRTFVKGNPSTEQKKIYTLVLKAFLRAYNADLSKYKTCFDIDKIAREFLNKNKPDGFNFGHGLGHSVGRCVHDGLPTVSPALQAKMKIKKNMVFTIEPGLYKPGWGGVRLENTIHVIKEKDKLKFKSFSNAPFQKNLIEFSMLNNNEKIYLKEWELV